MHILNDTLSYFISSKWSVFAKIRELFGRTEAGRTGTESVYATVASNNVTGRQIVKLELVEIFNMKTIKITHNSS